MPIRTFSMNSPEFYEAICGPPDPWCWGPGLPKEPRARDPEVIVESDDVSSHSVGGAEPPPDTLTATMLHG